MRGGGVPIVCARMCECAYIRYRVRACVCSFRKHPSGRFIDLCVCICVCECVHIRAHVKYTHMRVWVCVWVCV